MQYSVFQIKMAALTTVTNNTHYKQGRLEYNNFTIKTLGSHYNCCSLIDPTGAEC